MPRKRKTPEEYARACARKHGHDVGTFTPAGDGLQVGRCACSYVVFLHADGTFDGSATERRCRERARGRALVIDRHRLVTG